MAKGSKWPWIVGGVGLVGAGVGAYLLTRKKGAQEGMEDPVKNAAAEAAGSSDEQEANQLATLQVSPQGSQGGGFTILTGAKITSKVSYTGGPSFVLGPAKAVVMWGQGYDDQRWYVGTARQGVDWFRMMSMRYSVNPPGVQGEWSELVDAIEGSNKVWVASPSGDTQVKPGDRVAMIATSQPLPAMNFVMPGGIYRRLDENPWGYYISNDRLRKFWIKAWTGWTDDTSMVSRIPPVFVTNNGKLYPTLFFFVRTPKEDEAFGAFHDMAQAISEYFIGEDKSGMLAQGAQISGDVKKSSRADIQSRTKDSGMIPKGKN